ncbi:MAG: PEGA domain-containing protein, partial [Myxococcota bacterium]|nr:PEGA domain-containing protein [Myxococcota bacterium]
LDSIKIRRGRKTVVEPELFELNGILRVSSTPANAQVVINGRMFGHTPLQEALAPGQYAVEVRLPDHQVFKKSVGIEAGQEVTLAPLLIYEATMLVTPTEPWYRNKWIWIGAASVIVTTSIITAVALTADDSTAAGYPTIRVDTTQ